MIDDKKREAFASLSSLFGVKKREEKPKLIRPPYNEDKLLFEKFCPTCLDTPCVHACEEDIIGLDNTKIPYLLFTKSGCTFCKECASVCPHDVLDEKSTSKIHADFHIDLGECMAWNSTICNSCADVCDEKAVKFLGMFRPQIEMDKCTGCGFCYGVCPSNAILFKYNHSKKEV
ncbi:MAG: 4Fe-4S binding protein [Campylobacteraceae bacterium]|nr:4Fe-4S binding protein [Campylobacteraceae bacterium]